jgi:hypothetical protein
VTDLDAPTITATGLWYPDGVGVRPWRSNAELIARGVVPLGFLRPEDRVLDPTYGKGVWWRDWQPNELVCHDIDGDGVDFRQLPHGDKSFDAVAYDPPYVSVGGRGTSTLEEFNGRYGLKDAPGSPKALAEMIEGGLQESWRVLRPGGILLAKTANYVSSGKLFPGSYLALEAALDFGFRLEDWFVFLGSVRPQPPRTRKCGRCGGFALDENWVKCVECGGVGRTASTQQHARQNVSYLHVLRRPPLS